MPIVIGAGGAIPLLNRYRLRVGDDATARQIDQNILAVTAPPPPQSTDAMLIDVSRC